MIKFRKKVILAHCLYYVLILYVCVCVCDLKVCSSVYLMFQTLIRNDVLVVRE